MCKYCYRCRCKNYIVILKTVCILTNVNVNSQECENKKLYYIDLLCGYI